MAGADHGAHHMQLRSGGRADSLTPTEESCRPASGAVSVEPKVAEFSIATLWTLPPPPPLWAAQTPPSSQTFAAYQS